MGASHPVIDDLRKTLAGSRASAKFVGEMEARIRQLPADMVDGRVLPKPRRRRSADR
jgi:hypothetical protein